MIILSQNQYGMLKFFLDYGGVVTWNEITQLKMPTLLSLLMHGLLREMSTGLKISSQGAENFYKFSNFEGFERKNANLPISSTVMQSLNHFRKSKVTQMPRRSKVA